MTHPQQFAALVTDPVECTVTELILTPSNPPGLNFVYDIKEQPELVKIPLPDFDYEPAACMYDLVFEAELLGGADLPPFLTFDPQEGFDVFTNNPEH